MPFLTLIYSERIYSVTLAIFVVVFGVGLGAAANSTNGAVADVQGSVIWYSHHDVAVVHVPFARFTAYQNLRLLPK